MRHYATFATLYNQHQTPKQNESPFKSFVERAAEAVRRNILTSAPDTSKAETWANITDPEYESDLDKAQLRTAESC